MKRYILVIAIGVLALFVALWAGSRYLVSKLDGSGAQACTADALICPDGTAVGRTGPNCEFAPCPTPTETPTGGTQTAGQSGPVLVVAKINQEVQALGRVGITPLTVLEDSRCPVDVQCIQAGTVRINARLVSGLGTATQEFRLGQAVTTETDTITLTSVLPVRTAGTQVASSEYIFTFEVKRR